MPPPPPPGWPGGPPPFGPFPFGGPGGPPPGFPPWGGPGGPPPFGGPGGPFPPPFGGPGGPPPWGPMGPPPWLDPNGPSWDNSGGGTPPHHGGNENGGGTVRPPSPQTPNKGNTSDGGQTKPHVDNGGHTNIETGDGKGSGDNTSKPQPEADGNAGGFVFLIPAGWKGDISSIGNQPYAQSLKTEYHRDGRRVSAVLTHKAQTPGAMHNPQNANTGIHIQELKQTERLMLKWERISGVFSDRISVVLANETTEEVIYQVSVFDNPGGSNADQVTTIRFTRAGPLADPLGLLNIQGDALFGLPKALEYFYYFQISDVARFKEAFKSFALPKIVTTYRLVNNPVPPPQTNPNHEFVGFNIAFSSIGIELFGLDPALIGDSAFLRGQMADSQVLGDKGVTRNGIFSPDWDAEYKANIHGIFLITAYNEPNAQRFIQDLEAAFTWAPKRSAIKKVVSMHGYPRPGDQGPNDPFGYRGGGITNPQVKGVHFTDAKPMRFTGSTEIPIGILVMGRDGDEDKDKRPPWAVDGSLIATRKLNCLVPELDAYCKKEGARLFSSLAPDLAAAKVGARLMGRWKNGTALTMSPDHDSPDIAKDDTRVNNFVFDQNDVNQAKCPFAAHMRKSNPRNDVPEGPERYKHLLRRHNMPYGPEVSDDERANGTIEDRGLHLCTHQSSIERGFRFVQLGYNNPNYPPHKPIEPGYDAIFGSTGKADVHRHMSGVDPAHPRQVTSFMERFVDCRGGEYFFCPSMSTLREYVAGV